MIPTNLFDLPIELHSLILSSLETKDIVALLSSSKASAKFFMQCEDDFLKNIDKAQFNKYYKILLKYFNKPNLVDCITLKYLLANAMQEFAQMDKSRDAYYLLQQTTNWVTAFIIIEKMQIKGEINAQTIRMKNISLPLYAYLYNIAPFQRYLSANFKFTHLVNAAFKLNIPLIPLVQAKIIDGREMARALEQYIANNVAASTIEKILEADKTLKLLTTSQKTQALFRFIENNNSDIKILEMLIAAGADINKSEFYLSNDKRYTKYASFGTSLMCAIDKQRPEITDFLIQKGADINIKKKCMNNVYYKDTLYWLMSSYKRHSPLGQAIKYAAKNHSSTSYRIFRSLFTAGGKSKKLGQHPELNNELSLSNHEEREKNMRKLSSCF